MSFGGLFDGGSGGARVVADFPYGSSAMPAGAISQSRLVSPSLTKPLLSSPGLSLALVTLISSIPSPRSLSLYLVKKKIFDSPFS